MKRVLKAIAKRSLQIIVSKRRAEAMILRLSNLAKIDLLTLVYKNMGILKFEDSYVSGERFVISHVLKELVNKGKPVFFDVGANVGDFSKALRDEFPTAEIYAFEPNTSAFELMQTALRAENVKCLNLGVGVRSGREKLFTYSNAPSSAHATLYRDVMLDIHHAKEIIEVESEVTTLDEFCHTNGIAFIDFLKVDTEGHDLDVLRGGSVMLDEGRIGTIQFEFNEMNVISRVFLRDFYMILDAYNLFRINTEKLIPLLQYNSINEIFKFQNMLAIRKATAFSTNHN
jgi:FkbM family methyltransferase